MDRVRDPERRRLLRSLALLAGAGVGVACRDPISGPGRAITSSSAGAAPVATTTRPPSVTRSPPTTRPAPSATTAPESTPVRPIDVLCADAWGGRPAVGAFVPHAVERMTVHHTGVESTGPGEGPGRARRHQAHHLGLGWPDLAYHFLVDAQGWVYEGRPVSARGDTGTEYDPTGHFLVALEGDFDRHDVPRAQLDRVADLLAWCAVEFGVAPSTIGGHAEVAPSTTCPGTAVRAVIDDGTLHRMTRDRVGTVAIHRVCGDEGREIVSTIEES